MAVRLLVVDDEEPIVFALERYFRNIGFQVDSATELEEAEALLSNRPYDALILDWRLTSVHGAEGLDVIDYVRERCLPTRIVVLTAYGSAELETEARRRGADAFLSKPQPLPALAQLVYGLLERGAS